MLYDWRESCLLIGPIYLDKSLCLPENWIKLVYMLVLVYKGQIENKTKKKKKKKISNKREFFPYMRKYFSNEWEYFSNEREYFSYEREFFSNKWEYFS